MLQYHKYPLKVWLTSAFLGSVFLEAMHYLTEDYNCHPSEYFANNWSEDIFFVFIFFGISSLLSIPCWLLFWVVYHQALKRFDKLGVRLLMIVVGQLLVIALGYLVLGDLRLATPDAYIVPCYCTALLIAILMYKVNSTIIIVQAPLR